MSYLYSKILAPSQKLAVFGQDVFTYAFEYVYPHEHKDIFPDNHDYSFGALIWRSSQLNNDITFLKEPKTIIIIDIVLNSLKKDK